MSEISIRPSQYTPNRIDLMIKYDQYQTNVVTLAPSELRDLHRALHAYDEASRPTDTVADLLNALDARGDEVSSAAANLIRKIGADAPFILDIENAEL